MKLRIRNNSIRIRLQRSEVRRLADAGLVEGRTEFGGTQDLSYAVETADVRDVCAEFVNGRIVVRVPRAVATRWAAGDDVGIEGAQPAPGGALKILVEKDFACTDAPADEPQDDAFPNPRHCT